MLNRYTTLSTKWFARVLAVAMASLVLAAAPKGEPQTPVEYLDLYLELEASLTNFEGSLDERLAGVPSPQPAPLYGGTTKLATSNRNQYLLAPYLPWAVWVELERLQAVGVRAIVVDVNFPLLHQPYHPDAADREKYLNFYRWVADEIRRPGLKLIVSSWVNVATPPIQAYYEQLSWNEYVDGRMDVARTIAREMQPDYLLLGSEPDVEAMMSGQPIDNPESATEMLTSILDGLEAAGVRTMPVGAGIGTWQASYQDFVSSYSANTSLDFIDFHIYPTGLDFLSRIEVIANTAREHGKSVSMSESWLYKVRESELGGSIGNIAFQRDMYSFWSPLDRQFMAIVAKLAKVEGLLFAAPFFTDYFYDYLDYETVKDLSFQERLSMHTRNWITNMGQGTLTETGLEYQSAITP